jgi:hypothetical protein
VLLDEVLLEIFDFYVGEAQNVQAWQLLVHVSRRWRIIIFGSQHRLNLRLVCTPLTPVSDILEVWPALPLVIQGSLSCTQNADNLIALLGLSDRVCEINLDRLSTSKLEYVSRATHVPFLRLTHLRLSSFESMGELEVPDSFLNGAVPRLRRIAFHGTSFPGLPKLLPSVACLVTLHLTDIPDSGYLSPEAMVTGLSTLTSLEDLRLQSRYPRFIPDRQGRRRPPLTPTDLPALTRFEFKGDNEYSEDFVAQIDAPRLDTLKIDYFHQLNLDTSQLVRFINRVPTFTAPKEAHLVFFDLGVRLTFVPTTGDGQFYVETVIWNSHFERLLSRFPQICTSFSPIISTLEFLYIYEHRYHPPAPLQDREDDIENRQWLDILRPFIAVNKLYLTHNFASRIAPALQSLIGEGVTEVLPSLQNIFLELEVRQQLKSIPGRIQHFLSSRRLSGHPIAISRWNEATRAMTDGPGFLM